jgi:sulfite exporter TauE/SafE
MVRLIDQIAAVLVALLGAVHLWVGHQAFVSPSERGVWFLSAGFLLILTGLTNLARVRASAQSRLQSFAALCGAVSILVSGALIAVSNLELLVDPRAITLLVLGLLLTGFSLRDLVRRP